MKTDSTIQAQAPEPGGKPENSLGTILVADDDEMLRLATSRILIRAGYSVREAIDARSAMAILREAPPTCSSPMWGCQGATICHTWTRFAR